MADSLQVRAAFIEVDAAPRYWEDAQVNGVRDTDGNLIPFRDGEAWKPVIDLNTGVVTDWPGGTIAAIHYKVCDQGVYWLLDAERRRIARYRGHCVPDEFLCHGDQGFGDYIILNVWPGGEIDDWTRPTVDEDRWEGVAP